MGGIGNPWQPHLADWYKRYCESDEKKQADKLRAGFEAQDKARPDHEHIIVYDDEAARLATDEEFNQETE